MDTTRAGSLAFYSLCSILFMVVMLILFTSIFLPSKINALDSQKSNLTPDGKWQRIVLPKGDVVYSAVTP